MLERYRICATTARVQKISLTRLGSAGGQYHSLPCEDMEIVFRTYQYPGSDVEVITGKNGFLEFSFDGSSGRQGFYQFSQGSRPRIARTRCRLKHYSSVVYPTPSCGAGSESGDNSPGEYEIELWFHDAEEARRIIAELNSMAPRNGGSDTSNEPIPSSAPAHGAQDSMCLIVSGGYSEIVDEMTDALSRGLSDDLVLQSDDSVSGAALERRRRTLTPQVSQTWFVSRYGLDPSDGSEGLRQSPRQDNEVR